MRKLSKALDDNGGYSDCWHVSKGKQNLKLKLKWLL